MPAATVPTPESLIAAVVAQMQQIRVSNGYKTDVEHVYRRRRNEDQVQETKLPALFVLTQPNGHTFEKRDNYYRGTLRLVIGGMVSVGGADTEDDAPVTALNLLFEDVLDAMLEDPTFGWPSKVDSVLEAGDDDVDQDRGFGYFAITLHLTYNFERGTL